MTDIRPSILPAWRLWRPASLKARLLGLAALVLVVGLGIFAMQLLGMFREHVERNSRNMLDTYLEQLVVAVQRQPQGGFDATPLLPDPRFVRPLSGYYWQVVDARGRVVARSRSLWDALLPMPPAPLPARGALHYHPRGPNGEKLLATARRLVMESNSTRPRPLTFVVAMDAAAVEKAVQAFRQDLAVSLMVLALVLLAALLIQVWLGLRPLEKVRHQLAALRKGKVRKLNVPDIEEIRGLVEELDKLLQAQQHHMEQARARAGNLAHGLKTPLAALAALARDMVEDGQTQRARAVLHQVYLLRQHVERELSRSRVRGSRNVARPVWLAGTVQRLLRTLRTLHEGGHPAWQVDIPEQLQVRMEEGDLLELTGNLLDNAAKWATACVRISAHAAGHEVILQVEDDGPGVPEAERQRIVQRGVRLDEDKPGSGLGLAIVQEIVNAYDGSLRLSQSALGGLLVRVHLPLAENDTAERDAAAPAQAAASN